MMMNFEDVIGDRMSSIYVTALRKRKDEIEEIEYIQKLHKDEIACLYQSRYGVFILKKNGILTKVKHSLQEIENTLNI